MKRISIAGKVIAGGLILWVGPLFAQDYIDVEAERERQALQEQQGGYRPSSPQQTVPVNPTSTGGTDTGELYYQLQLLQQEVMELRGRVEEQEYQLKQLREQSLERYLDLDQRLKAGGGAGAGQASAGSSAPATGGSAQPSAQPLAGEAEAYRAAYSLVRSQQFSQAVGAFQQFLVEFPGGRYTPNAHYWLGELYLVISPPDDESARREFTRLLEEYPENSKVPDALYKLGKIYYDRGNRERAKEHLDRVINEYGDSGSSAVKLARDFLSQNF